MKNKLHQLVFITGNASKLKEFQELLPNVIGKNFDLPEIQEIDAEVVIKNKLKEAQKQEDCEYIVEDTSLYIDGMNGLPGPLIKWFLETIEAVGVSKLTEIYGSAGKVVTIIGYINQDGEVRFFKGELEGNIVAPRGVNGFGWDTIFQPKGENKTFGEMSQEKKNTISMRMEACKKLSEYLKK